MRKRRLPYAVRGLAVCALGCLGSLIFQGCKEETPDPYAALDAAFPEGTPLVAGVEERAQDKAYQAEITAGAEKFLRLKREVETHDAALAHYKQEYAASYERRKGYALDEDLLEEALRKQPLYAEALAKRTAAAEAMEAQRRANVELIRDRMHQPQREYDALLAEADAKAKAAGLSTRAEARALQQQAEAAKVTAARAASQQQKVAMAEAARRERAQAVPAKPSKAKPAAPTVTLEDLSKQTGIPIAPEQPQAP